MFKSRSWLSHKEPMLASLGISRLPCSKLQMKKGLEGKMKEMKEKNYISTDLNPGYI